MFFMFTACFAEEVSKECFSFHNFHGSLKEKEVKVEVLKA